MDWLTVSKIPIGPIAKDAVNGYLFELAQTGVWNAKLEGMWQNAPIEGVVLRDIHWAE